MFAFILKWNIFKVRFVIIRERQKGAIDFENGRERKQASELRKNREQ